MVLPTIGNNDGRNKNEAVDETNKSDYDGLIYDLWFTELPGNASLDLDGIKQTVMNGAYYRADVAPGVTVLSINSMYFAASDLTVHQDEASNIMIWLETNLELAASEDR